MAEKEITPQEAQKALKEQGIVLVDVRMPDEFLVAHAPGAVNIPLHDLSKKFEELRVKKGVYLICRSGRRSAFAQRMLSDAGIQNAYNVSGGMIDWISAGLPKERSK